MNKTSTTVMGIVNVTPDSFSDGGRFFATGDAVRHAESLVADGADIIDLGGESTRPGSTPLTWEEEWRRLEPVVKRLSSGFGGRVPVLSVDTYHPETAERAVANGVRIVNCVYADTAVAMARICVRAGAELVFPYRLTGGGHVPALTGSIPDVLKEVRDVLPLERLYLDPMIGFGTTRAEDLDLIRSVPAMAAIGRVLVGASRKRIVQALTGEGTASLTVGGSVGVAVWAALHGASVVRVHDVRETVQALRVFAALSLPT